MRAHRSPKLTIDISTAVSIAAIAAAKVNLLSASAIKLLRSSQGAAFINAFSDLIATPKPMRSRETASSVNSPWAITLAKDKEKEQLTENMNKLHIEGSSSFGNGSPNFRRKPVIIIVVGMTDTGKTTFLHTLVCHTQMSNIRGYVVNLDPAIMTLPFAANIDIRDTVVDTPRSENPTTFMSNMLYACSILYKTRLPLILAFNKVDVAQHEFALEELGIKRIFWNTFSLNCQIEILGSCRTTNFAGPLPDYIANLMRLEYLNLADNNFSGSVPATWDRLSSLKHLLLKGNDLSGHIPDTIANLTGLAELDLSSNGLTGTIPMPLFSIPIFK
ncbi:hypothetical protein Ahy_B09g098948 [Arachis hypogaea]|uniref:GPN-loop GTPase n=1 Tax=Arachis hypogaea TaxID=3818 RepID=A0A444XSI7_ARAHY|nr:hypothetical protein Ahy_B09g098948 [Arachis hypogaea]